jgi:hypothetical protein
VLVAVADRRPPPAVAATIATHAVAAVVPVFIRARRQRPAWWRQRLDCLLHDLTPLPVQAGEDAVGVHPAPATTTALFGPNFLANLVRRPLAVYLLVAINYVPQPWRGRPPLEQRHPQQTALVTTSLLQDEAVATPAVVIVEQQSCKGR